MKQKMPLIILTLILLGGALVKLYRFDNPIADWHSWRQADTSAVSRNFVEHGYDLLHPRFDDLSNIPSGKDNPQGYRFVEFPIYNIAQAGLYQLFGIFTLEEWGRLVSIFSSVLAAFFLYLIVSRHGNKQLGLLTAFFYSLTPYNIYYGRTILPDTSMVMAILGGIYFFDLYLNVIARSKTTKQSSLNTRLPRFARNDSSLLFFVLAVLFTMAAFLLKPYAVFFTLPMVVLAYKRWGWKLVLQWQLWLFAIICVAPLVWWRHWMTHYPEGIPANKWLLNGNGIRFKPSFFKWIGYERLTKLISGYTGIVFLALGGWQLVRLKEWTFLLSFLVSSLLYVCVFATGNVQHDYYQIMIMPSVAIFMALGSYYLFRLVIPTNMEGSHTSVQQKKFGGIRFLDSARNDKNMLPIGAILAIFLVAGSFYFSWMQVRDYFNINNRSIIAAGEAVDRLTPKDAKVIANYTGDTSFLYQTHRKGWPSFEKGLPEMIEMGADFLVLANPSQADLDLGKTYKIVEKTPQYVIFDLRKKP